MKYLDLFDRDFSQGLGVRARSFRQVFELLLSLHYPPYTIVETGVTNLPVPPLPWKAPSPHGHSSVLFQHFLSHHGGRLYSVDINPEHCAVALGYADDHAEIVCADSRRFLHQRRFQSPINCLYLDSLDIDWGNPHVSAYHHLEELDAAVRKLAPRSLVVVDDSPHLKGKGAYVSDYMARLGAQLLFDNYQAGWLLPDKFYALPVLCNAEQSTSECLAQIIATRWFRYVREGYDERILELCHDHTIGEGNAACEERWFLEPNGNSWTLVFVGQGQITCRLEQSRDGVWKGSWLNYERMPVTLTPQDLRRGQHARLAGTWDVVLATGVKNRVEIMRSGNLGFGSRLLGCTWTIDPSEDLVINSETGVVARFRFSADRLRAHCVESRNHLKGSTLVRSKPLGFAARRLQELVTQLTWFDAATNIDHWPLELLPNGVIGKGRSHQFQNWDVEELDGIIYLVLSNHDRISRLKQDRSSRRVRFVSQDGLITLRQVDRGRGAYLLPYFTAAIPRSNIRTIVEIGCGDGDDSIALQRFYEADVFAFECNPDFADIYRTRVAVSNRVHFYELGIADHASDGQTFYVTHGKNPSASSFFVANSKYPYENYEQRPVKVATTTLDEWAAEAGVAGVDLLCMDCQGGALAALRGGEEILSRTQFIVTELATRPIYQDEPLAAEVVAMLRGRRFQLIRSLNQWGVTNGGRFYDNPNYDRRYQDLESWFGDYLFKRMSESEHSLADEIIRQRYFLYKRIGSDERLLELLADGRIGAGAEEFELNWMVQDQTDGETHLLILGLNHVTCRLVQESHGRFIGRWLLFEQLPIELVSAASPDYTPVRFPPQFGCTRGQFSQQDEADILLGILELIKGRTNRTFVEIGVGPRYGFDPQIYGLECNCRVLRERGWQGWMFDLNQYPDDFGVIQAHFSAANAVEIFAQNHIPDLIDVLSIDIDGQDYWVWQALGSRAQVVCIEYNCSVEGAKVVPEDPDFLWDGTSYFGASLAAMKMLGERLDYALVHTNNVNAIFVQRSLISNPDEFLHAGFAPVVPIHPADPFGRPWLDLSTFHDATLRPNRR